uniref:Uncharacterized protein n=1 Tax=Amphimedon queenslandica TaxID=400682 RepID=A0A1X7UTE3_AMPQE
MNQLPSPKKVQKWNSTGQIITAAPIHQDNNLAYDYEESSEEFDYDDKEEDSLEYHDDEDENHNDNEEPDYEDDNAGEDNS